MDGAHGAVKGEVGGCGFYCVMVSNMYDVCSLYNSRLMGVPHKTNPTVGAGGL